MGPEDINPATGLVGVGGAIGGYAVASLIFGPNLTLTGAIGGAFVGVILTASLASFVLSRMDSSRNRK